MVRLAALLPQLLAVQLLTWAAATRILRGRHADAARGSPLPYRQRLENHLNAQYHGSLEVGGQRVKAILDTGSFELLVVSALCKICHDPPYNASSSSTFYASNVTNLIIHQFGSGPTESMQGLETVKIGPLEVANQTFYQIVDHDIRPLNSSDTFNAIVGIGPEVTRDPSWALVTNHTAPSLLESLGVTEFSVCIEPKDGAPGWLTWGGDLTPAQKNRSVELHLVGKHHWAVKMHKMLPVVQLSDKQKSAAGTLLCKAGCAAILDSGTSLISAPSHSLDGLRLLLPALNENCSNLDDLPDLEFDLDGRIFRLPAEAYVMRLHGNFHSAMAVWEKLLVKPNLTFTDQCFYAFLEIDAHTDFGPLWVFGLPFFRYFHTTFKLAPEVDDRRIFLSKASEDCTPLPLKEEIGPEHDEADILYKGVGVYPKIVVAQEAAKVQQASRPRRQPVTVGADELRLPTLPLAGGL